MKQKFLTLLLAVFMMVAAFSMNSEAAETEEIPVFEELSEMKERPEIEQLPMLEEPPVLERMTAFSEQAVFTGAQDQLEIYDGGYCDDGKTMWAITTDGVLMFFTDGTTRGTLVGHEGGSGAWTVYEKYIWWVIIDGTIDKIPERMFANDYKELMYVDVLDGVKSIGMSAFSNLPKLEEVVLADSITTIDYSAFYSCKNLTSINIPKRLKKIPADFITFAEKVKSITIPNGVTEISRAAFFQTGIENLVIPNSVKKIGPTAFAISGLRSITLPEGLTEIADETFRQCWYLKKVNIPSTVTKIGESAFERCYSLGAISIPGAVTTIGKEAFKQCTALASISIPGSVKKIDTGAFSLCEKLRTVNIASGVTTIGGTVFSGCAALEKITIPGTVTYIGTNTFLNCTSLKEATLPSNMTAIPDSMFEGCSSLKTFKFPSKLEKIGNKVFYNCTSLSSMRIPTHVKEIGEKAFGGCSNLGKVSIMNANASFGKNVFQNAPNLVLACYENSTAHTYAVNNNYNYQFLDMSKVTDYFADVAEGKWFVNSVQYVYDKGLMSGSGESFNPTKNVTRAQLVTTLYRLAGSPEVVDYSACKDFSDVEEGKYYTDAVCWAYNEGITTGNDGKFNTTANLTRQQMAAFIFRYAAVMGYDVSANADFSAMLNADKVSEYAVEAMQWAVGAGLISGSEVKDDAGNVAYDLNPKGNTTRAQLSAILQRFCEGFVDVETPDNTDELPGVPIV